MTNADKIRNMTDEELEQFLIDVIEHKLLFCGNSKKINEWLNKDAMKIKIFQFSYESSEAENGVASITYELKGTEGALKDAEILWLATIELSNAEFHNKNLAETLIENGWSGEDAIFILDCWKDKVSPDPVTAYNQCLNIFKELGLTIKESEDSDKADVWASYSVY